MTKREKMAEAHEKFKEEYIELCKRHGLALMSIYSGDGTYDPSAHDPLGVVGLEQFKDNYSRIWTFDDLESSHPEYSEDGDPEFNWTAWGLENPQ